MSICSRRFRFTFGKPCARASAMNGDPKTDYVKSEIATNDDVINTEDVKLIIDEAKLFLDDVKTVIDELELGIFNVKFDTEIVTDDAQLVIDDGQTDNESLEVHSDDEMGTDKGVFCCVKRCESMFNNGFKSLLKSSVSKLSWSEKRIFLFTMVTVNKTKTHRNIKCPKQHLCFRYVVKEFGVERPVCKKAFVRLHGVTLSMVNSVLDNVYEILPLDGRGKHNNHHTIPKELQELIRIHLFKVIDSHAVGFLFISVTRLCLYLKKF